MKTYKSKHGSTITLMTREETGVVSPAMLCKLKPFTDKGHSIGNAKSMLFLMEQHGMSVDEAIDQHLSNLEWANE